MFNATIITWIEDVHTAVLCVNNSLRSTLCHGTSGTVVHLSNLYLFKVVKNITSELQTCNSVTSLIVSNVIHSFFSSFSSLSSTFSIHQVLKTAEHDFSCKRNF